MPRPSGRQAIDKALARIVAAGRIPGMPDKPDRLVEVQAKGCRHIYTHVPPRLGIGAPAFLKQ